MRQAYELLFTRLSASLLPPGVEMYHFGNVKLHPLIKPEGGWDNTHTIFGLTDPKADGRSIVFQVSETLEKSLATGSAQEVAFELEADLRRALEYWPEKALPHEHSLKNIVRL